MIRGLFSSLEFPYAHFATRGASANTLFPLVWEAVERLEYCGFDVIAFCCDGASPNRKFYKMHGSATDLIIIQSSKSILQWPQYLFYM